MKMLECVHMEPLPGVGYVVAPALLLPFTEWGGEARTLVLCAACVERGQQLAREDGQRRLSRKELATGTGELVRMLRERGGRDG